MTIGLLVEPDLRHEYVEFTLDTANLWLGGESARVSVAFWPGRATFAALHNRQAREPNPAASLAYSTFHLGDGSFLQDPTNAIYGPVIFTGADGGDLDANDAFQIQDGIRAVSIYRQDNVAEFRLWRNAAINFKS